MFFRLRLLLLTLLFAGSCLWLPAADLVSGAPSAVQKQRAEKIAGNLGLADAAQTARVRDLIARQYHELSLIHATRDAAIAAAKAQAGADKAVVDAAIKQARSDAEAAQDRLHPAYLARLATELAPAQVEQVKDGMTYGVLPLTYRVYQEMLPDLTDAQKAQILAWLTEAREHAMDASTSDEKHAWFGKYKGRINNFLSHAGIDMKQAEKDLKARQQAGKK